MQDNQAMSPSRSIALLLLLISMLPGSARALLCLGDCDTNGSVEVDEIIRGVGVALEQIPLELCPSFDENGSQAVEIDELTRAVGNALQGCPGDAAAIGGATVATARALNNANSALIDVITTINGDMTGVDDQCPLSGTSIRSCEDVRQGVARIVVTLTDCGYQSQGGDLVLNGRIALTAPGRCPSTFIPLNITADMDVVGTQHDSTGRLTRTAVFQLGGSITGLTVGDRPCMVKGGAGKLGGTVAVEDSNGNRLALDLSTSDLTLLFADFGSRCSPRLASLALDGDGVIHDRRGGQEHDYAVSFDGLTAVTRRSDGGDSISLSGGIGGPCMGQATQVSTAEPLNMPSGAECPNGGALMLQRGSETVQTTIAADGSFTLDSATVGSPESFPSCRAEALNACGR